MTSAGRRLRLLREGRRRWGCSTNQAGHEVPILSRCWPEKSNEPGNESLHCGDIWHATNSYNDAGGVGGFLKLGTPILASFLAVVTTACGNSSPRMLQSIIANPASADAQNFPNGKVQFTPTGIFNKPPTPVTPLPVCSAPNSGDTCITAWLAFPNTIATVDQNGVAQCLPGQSGIVTIAVAVAGDAPAMDVAKLTCP